MATDMGMGMGDGSAGPLSPDGVDFSNATQASDFLAALLNDTELKVIGNSYARYFWYGVLAAIAIAAFFHWTRWFILRRRILAAVRGASQPARPKTLLESWFATATALVREATYFQMTPVTENWSWRWLRVPTGGTIILVLAYFAFVLGLEFTNNTVAGAQFWQARGIRAGWLAVAQIPLLVLLTGKNNLITLCTGVSFERLNVIHRWAARVTLFLAILHFGYQSYGWNRYGVMQLEWATDSCPPTGMAAFALLLWINLSTLAPFRHFSYEFFVVQHIITFMGFIIALAYHIPSTATWARIYVFIPSALYIIDRLIRTSTFAWNNRKSCRATFTALDGEATRVTIKNSAIQKWRPGAYVQLSIPRFGMIQAHPATIMSTPKSHNGDLVFILKSQKGFTKRIMESANSSTEALSPRTQPEGKLQVPRAVITHWAATNGPYGGLHEDFAAFDSICLIAGSTGCTFTLALLQNIAERTMDLGQRLPLQRIRFIWCIRSTSWVSWISDEIATAVRKLRDVGIETEVTIHVTCSDPFTEQSADPKACGCRCDKSKGPCCCVSVGDEADGTQEESTTIEPTISDGKMRREDQAKPEMKLSVTRAKRTGFAKQLSILPCADFYSGRPDIEAVVTELLDGADGESGIAVCGPVGLSATVRNWVVSISDQRAVHKGTGAQGVYLHVENFS